ncbi:homeobox protein goosecoid [Stegastes partitus]|uniref:Homeobox protein goosecoid n=1 Tax=Stegastes partitus TaxID=144197 RepID=A0A9Y4KH20_9TELE|nr:PREDICTED: homeobox protein goosecoid-like [Stegastes partitus]
MPAGMFSIDSILSARPSCKEPLLLHRSGPVVLSAGLTDSLYTDYNGLYSATCGPSGPGVQSVNGTRLGYNGYYYGQLHVQGAGGGPPCCGSVAGLSAQQCPCIPTEAGAVRYRNTAVWFKNRRAKWRRQKRSSSEESENSQKWSKAPKTAAAAAAAEKPEESKSDVESDS